MNLQVYVLDPEDVYLEPPQDVSGICVYPPKTHTYRIFINHQMCGHVAELPPSQDASKPASDFTIKNTKMLSMLTKVQVYVITP